MLALVVGHAEFITGDNIEPFHPHKALFAKLGQRMDERSICIYLGSIVNHIVLCSEITSRGRRQQNLGEPMLA